MHAAQATMCKSYIQTEYRCGEQGFYFGRRPVCEALGECELQQKYFDTFAKLQPLPELERKVLTKPQVAEIRKKNNTLVVVALNLLKQTSITSPQLSTTYECMTILTMYGQDKRLEPLRRSDWLK